MERFIMAAGCALRISDSGQSGMAGLASEGMEARPVIFLLHGYLESLDVWDGFVPLLRDRARVVAMDLAGHGISEVKGEIHTMSFLADAVNGALDELGIEKCLLVGHSMGGYAALEVADRYPGRLSGLVLMQSTPDPDTEEKKQQRLREIEVVLAGKKDLLAQTVDKGFAPDNRLRFADFIEELRDQVVLTEEDGIVALLRGMMARGDMNGMLQRSGIPQMFIFGRKDEYIPVGVAEGIVARHTQAMAVWLEDSGHMGFVEQPEASADAILDFCMGTVGPR